MTKPGRNAPCPCGSGLKYKRCCELKDHAPNLDPVAVRETFEATLSDTVYNAVLFGIWSVFHPNGQNLPDIEVLEDFYFEIYGYELDRDSLDDLVLPLPEAVFAPLFPGPQSTGAVIDLPAEPET